MQLIKVLDLKRKNWQFKPSAVIASDRRERGNPVLYGTGSRSPRNDENKQKW